MAAAWMALVTARPTTATEETFRFRIDPERSQVRFDGETTLHDLDGEARKFQGEGRAPGTLSGPDVTARVVIEAASIKTGNSLRDYVMRRNTLEVEKYPEIVFVAEGATPAGALRDRGPVKLILKGRLDLHGIVKEKQFPVTVERLAEGFVVSGKFPIRMSEHHIPDPSLFFNKVKDELIAIFKFTAVPVP
ncbi:MAG: YceI family protein [Nitrospinota bacterium]